MHGYVLGFPVIAEIDVDLPKSIATTSRDPRFHLSEFQSGPTSSLFATFFRNACYNVIMRMQLQMNYVVPWRPLFSRAPNVACTEPNDRRTNHG